MRSLNQHAANHALGVIVTLICAVGLLGLACSQAPSEPCAEPAVQPEQPAAADTAASSDPAPEQEQLEPVAGDQSAKAADAKPEAKAKPKRKFRSTFYTTDRLGSPSSAVVVDEEGNARVVERYDYDATGNRTVTAVDETDAAGDPWRERYDRIKYGMTRQEVEQITGPPTFENPDLRAYGYGPEARWEQHESPHQPLRRIHVVYSEEDRVLRQWFK
jgi:hypothetical protein